MNLKLFNSERKENCNEKKKNDSEYCCLLESDSSEITKVKFRLQKWFNRFPENINCEVYRRFIANEIGVHRGALFELYLHEMLFLSGYDIKIHPDIENEENTPDFYAKRKQTKFYLEAKVSKKKSQQETKEGRVGSLTIHETRPIEILRVAINKKHPAKYSLQNKPYILALNICTNGLPIDNETIKDAIYGFVMSIEESEIQLIIEGQIGKYDEKNNTFFYRNRDVSAILITTNLNAFTLTDKKATLYINPVANTPIPKDILPIDTIYYNEEKREYVTKKGKENKDLFNI